ncbi:MAG: thiamine phosphate synthase [Spirochaetales bacterium]|nr:thiamine phosphate synthase [Spirochaetales bacterium]
MIQCFGLYVILSNPVAGYEKCAEAAVKTGVKFVQLRMKNIPYEEVLETAKRIRQITSHTGSLFIINDDVRIAAEAGADGVHLGQEDMSLKDARLFWNEPGKIYGLSTHNEKQAESAMDMQPDYIGVGPVYKTPTKERPDPVLGLDCMGKIIKNTPLPCVAIGGIDLLTIKDVLHSGAVNFSTVRVIMQSEYPVKVMKKFIKIWEEIVYHAKDEKE